MGRVEWKLRVDLGLVFFGVTSKEFLWGLLVEFEVVMVTTLILVLVLFLLVPCSWVLVEGCWVFFPLD